MNSRQRVIKTKANNFISDTLAPDYQTLYMHPVASLLPENGSGSTVTVNDNTPSQTLNPVPVQPPESPIEPPTPYPGADPILSEVPITTLAVVPETVAEQPPISAETQEHLKKNWWVYLLIAAAVVGLIVAYKKGMFK